MKRKSSHRPSRGQTALEYLLLLALVAGVALLSFRTFIPDLQKSLVGTNDSNEKDSFYGKVTRSIIGGEGNEPVPVNGGWCDMPCPSASVCGPAVIYQRCECPTPAFGGAACPEGGGTKICPRPSNCPDGIPDRSDR